MESRMAGGEAGNEDIEIGQIRFTVLLHLVVDFYPFFRDGAYPFHIVGAAVQELPELGRINKFIAFYFIGLLSEFATFSSKTSSNPTSMKKLNEMFNTETFELHRERILIFLCLLNNIEYKVKRISI